MIADDAVLQQGCETRHQQTHHWVQMSLLNQAVHRLSVKSSSQRSQQPSDAVLHMGRNGRSLSRRRVEIHLAQRMIRRLRSGKLRTLSINI